MIISHIVAVSSNHVIGKNNKLPWSLPADMKYFKNTTWAMPVLMGRKTFESLGKPLPGRTNIVITRNKEWHAAGVSIVQTVDEAISITSTLHVKEIFIIGGEEIFRLTLPMANRLYITRIDQQFEGDAFYPEVNEQEWKLVSEKNCLHDAKNLYNYSFQVWERK